MPASVVTEGKGEDVLPQVPPVPEIGDPDRSIAKEPALVITDYRGRDLLSVDVHRKFYLIGVTKAVLYEHPCGHLREVFFKCSQGPVRMMELEVTGRVAPARISMAEVHKSLGHWKSIDLRLGLDVLGGFIAASIEKRHELISPMPDAEEPGAGS